MSAAEVRVLGPVELVVGDGAVPLPAKQRRLLAALVVAAGRPCGQEELVDAVWGPAPPASARKLLQIYVSALRKVLPQTIPIETRAGAYALAVDGDDVDAHRFERLVAESAAARAANPALAASLAEQALALWRGRAYGELAYEDRWRAESERLDELRLLVVEERLAARLELAPVDALGEALALAAEQPLRERPQELAMLALYRAGRQAEALDHFAQARAYLVDELGLEPGPALRDLQARILRHDRSLGGSTGATTSGRALPIPPNPLVGRERELAELGALLARRAARLLVLTGAGGSGKTRLALEVARAAAPAFANGALFVELAPVRDPALVATTILAALDLAPVPGEPAEETLAAALAGQELLLVVDNAEHLRAGAPLFAELAARASRLTILVTSRAVLHVSGERVFPVAPLDEGDAVELFLQRARALEPGFAPAAGDLDELREICRRVDGLPLAVELAAAWIRTLTPRALRERLDERLEVLTRGPRDLPARQRTLRETIAWSVQLLPERERQVFARLAVFPGGATLDAAEQACGADLETLAALVDGNLLRRVDLGGEPRYALLETIREYALALLGDDRAAAERALAVYLVGQLERAELKGPAQASWLPRLDADLDNLRAALDATAAAGEAELELRLAGGLWRYWWIRGALAEGLGRLERALARDAGAPSDARARALAGAAGLAWSAGDPHRARTLAEQAVEVAQAAGALPEESQAHTVLGVLTNSQGDHEAARHHHARSVEISEELGLEPVVEKLNLGVVALDSGDHEAAVALLEDVLASHRRNGVVEGIGFALLNLGLARYELGDASAAAADFEEARAAFAEIGFRAQLAHALQGLAGVASGDGRHEEAAGLLGAAAAELDEVGWARDDFAPELTSRVEAAARGTLGDDGFAAAYAEGRAAAARASAAD